VQETEGDAGGGGGGGCAPTVTISESDAVPAAPVHVTVYVVFATTPETNRVPEVAPPVEKFAPVQVVALVEPQESCVEPPYGIEVGHATRFTVGGTG